MTNVYIKNNNNTVKTHLEHAVINNNSQWYNIIGNFI